MLRRHPPIALDVRAIDLLRALLACLRPFAAPAGEALVSLCVRTAFDLFLQARALPAGSEVLVGAITHPDMAALLRHHGLVPVAVDLDPLTLSPVLPRASGPARALLVTHLFGARLDGEALAAWCRAHGVELWEDCAQAYRGPDYTGHPEALISMFSFGPLKTSTALGGALSWVREPGLRARMESLQAGYPLQSTRAYAWRVLKYAMLHGWMQPLAYGLLCSLVELRRADAVEMMRGWLAGFPGGFQVERLRRRPCAALRRTLAWRLARPPSLGERARAGAQLAALLKESARPGPRALGQTCWIFPVLVDDRARTVRALRQAGFDGIAGLSNLIALEPAPVARSLIEHSLIVPLRAGWSQAEIARLGRVLSACGC